MATTAPSPPPTPVAGTPLSWRIAILTGVGLLGGLTYLIRDTIGLRGQALGGIFCLLGMVAAASTNLRAVHWPTIYAGIALQFGLALFILRFEIDGVRPGYEAFRWIGGVVQKFLEFSDEGAQFVFGPLAKRELLQERFGANNGFVFAFMALPTVIFVSSFFTVLYHFGILQFIVRISARVMVKVMGTSGAESLSSSANVFMGQTEAPLIVKPYVPGMTRSELLALMVGGMATISGGVMAVYINLGADAVAILTTSVMAAPAGLYLSKLLVPELEQPQTRGYVTVAPDEKRHANVIDAAACGASDGMMLAINIAAMLIAFLAFIAMINYLLIQVNPDLSLQRIFATLFAPLAFLIGTPEKDLPLVGELLGTKLALNEFVAYIDLTSPKYRDALDPHSYTLATFALTGFANFSSIGIQLGGIGAMAPERRGDLARLGGLALIGGFFATLINAAIAGLLLA